MSGDATAELVDAERASALDEYAALEAGPQEQFDFLARLAAEICGTRMAGITFIDRHRQHYRVAYGMESPEVTKDDSFCRHTLASGGAMVVEDALADERFRDSPLVTAGPELRFYAGAPLCTRGGVALGALCVMDTEPRELDARSLELLQGLARQVMVLLERGRGESELELAKRRLRDDQRLAHVAAWEWDAVSDQATWTPEMRALLGVGDEVEGSYEAFLALIHEDDRARFEETVAAAMEAGGRLGHRIRIVRPDGEVRTLDTEGEVELDAEGNPVGMWGATVDVTDLVEAEERSREQAEGLSAAFQTALDPTLVTDAERRFVHVNRAACRLLGYSGEQLRGMRVEDVVAEPAREQAIAIWERFVEQGQQRGEIQLRRSDGALVLAEYSATANFVPGRHLTVLRDVTERREAEREANESRRRLEETQALAQVGSWEWDLASELQISSPELLRILGRGEVSPEPSYEEFVEYVHPDDRDSFVEVVATSLRTKAPFRQVFRVITESGEVRTVESHGRVKVNRHGEPVRMLGAAQDITEREQAAQELRLQANVLDQLPVGVIASDGKRRITLWNHGAEVLTGISGGQALGRTVDDLDLFPDVSQETRAQMRERLSEGRKWEGEIEIVGPDGEPFPALVTNSPVRDSGGEIVGYVGVTVDLTEQRTIETELQLLSQVLDQVHSAVIALDLEHRITHWSKGAERLYGWVASEAIGAAATELRLIDPSSDVSPQELQAAVESGDSWEGEFEARRKDGTSLPVLTSTSAIRDPQGRRVGFFEISVDISARKRAEEEAREARLETIQRLARAVETRDAETGGHIERIGEFAAMLSERLGADERTVELIRVSSPMHDVGKIGIADEILLKPGKLTSAERTVMERHTQIGYEILAGSDNEMLDMAARIALTHHERVDGSGYPQGLEGEGIPLVGRIVAVADVFDALTSDRVYRKAFSVERAVEMMREERGSHFDPRILDALLEDLESFVRV